MSIDTLFEQCKLVDLLLSGGETDKCRAREILIDMIARVKYSGDPIPVLLNHLLRRSGLYPYIEENAQWDDLAAKDMFYQDCGESRLSCLHLEQSRLLKMLATGESLVVSAPTSFGKSYVVDALIHLKNPDNVMIIVPTIALTDETRRRLHRKFSRRFKIITTCDEPLGKKNIFVFPQERAVSYHGKISKLDLLVIDEFYKSSADFDKERSPALLDAIIKFKPISKQCYCLAPNIDVYEQTLFTGGMRFVRFTLPTVVLSIVDRTEQIDGDQAKKEVVLLDILRAKRESKTLVYAGNFTEMGRVADIIRREFSGRYTAEEDSLLIWFAKWLRENYTEHWILPDLIEAGAGLHSSRMHRSLAQLQLRLFEEPRGINFMISTSSIIEGVNTSAENVVIWSKKNGHADLNLFTYKNVCGRAGRMFRYFVGNVFVLEKPKFKKEEYNLKLGIADKDIPRFQDEDSCQYLSNEQQDYINEFRAKWVEKIGESAYKAIFCDSAITKIPLKQREAVILKLASKETVASLRGLLDDDVRIFAGSLKALFKLVKPYVDVGDGDFMTRETRLRRFICLLRYNWKWPVKKILSAALSELHIEVEDFFRLEKWATYEFAKLVQEIDVVQKARCPNAALDLQPLVSRMSNSFLPPLVFQLEEFGLPRIYPQMMQLNGIADFEDATQTLEVMLNKLILLKSSIMKMSGLKRFDRYILDYFYEGIQ